MRLSKSLIMNEDARETGTSTDSMQMAAAIGESGASRDPDGILRETGVAHQ